MLECPVPKACTACAKARRRCGKQRPQCMRCKTRGRTCIYPPSKPTSFVPLQQDTPATECPSSRDMIPTPPSPLIFCVPLLSDQIASYWFASPETWTIDRPHSQLISATTRFDSTDFSRILQKVFTWLSEWVETGSNPFIHRHLYRVCFPDSIQSAYMALSSYLHRTPGNTHIVTRIIAEQSTRLVEEGLVVNEKPTCLETLWNLPRVQALLVYQCIGLQDGDVHLRQLTESHMPVLESWIGIMMQQTSRAIHSLDGVDGTTPENLLWYSWIIAESVRRLWLVIAGLQGLYKYFTTPNFYGPVSRRHDVYEPERVLGSAECKCLGEAV
jgi:hypothetical protein